MAVGIGVTEILNQWANAGVFAYVIPFVLIFAVVFAILQKTDVFKGNNTVNAIIGAAVGLLAIQFDFVSTFFGSIFPRLGMGIAILLVFIILLGFFFPGEEYQKMKWVGYVLAIGVVVWAISSWNFWGSEYPIGAWVEENFWALLIIGLVIWAVYEMASPEHSKSTKKAE